jgi:hypothetical protein
MSGLTKCARKVAHVLYVTLVWGGFAFMPVLPSPRDLGDFPRFGKDA